jgi:hypothetical protein
VVGVSQRWTVVLEVCDADGVTASPSDVRERIEEEEGVRVVEMRFGTEPEGPPGG